MMSQGEGEEERDMEGCSSYDQVYKDQQDQQRYIQSDLDQTEPQPLGSDRNWPQQLEGANLHISGTSAGMAKQQEKLR